jgi:tetratricopeptide (TPR) repeat protein
VLTSVYQIMVGKWDEIRSRAQEARALCEKLGDYRQWGDSMEVLGESALIAGDIQFAHSILKTLLEDARQRRNPLQVCWGLFGVAAIYNRTGNEVTAIPMLKEELQILEELPNLASSINTYGQLALAHLRLGRFDEALMYADKVIDLAGKKSPTVYSMDIGFAAAAEVYFVLWEKALQNSSRGLDEAQHRLYARKALGLVRAFRNVFPIGQAYACYYQGWYEELTGRSQRAVRSWRRGLEAARKFKLLYEEGLLRVRLGSSRLENENARKEHLECALQIFEQMGAIHETRSAKWAWETLATK